MGVFTLVTAGTIVAGAVQGKLVDGVLIGVFVGGTFGVLTFMLMKGGGE